MFMYVIIYTHYLIKRQTLMVCYAVVIKNQLLVIINIYNATYNILYIYCIYIAYILHIKSCSMICNGKC